MLIKIIITQEELQAAMKKSVWRNKKKYTRKGKQRISY